MSLAIENSIDINLTSVHIWSSTAVEDNHRLDEFLKILSEDEVTRAGRYRFEKDRSVYITAKFLLRTLLGSYLEEKPEELTFDYSEFKKPAYSNTLGIDFNVSHSGNRIIIGFAKQQMIGVDIERIKQDFNPLDLAQNFFSEQEIELISKTEESELYQAFYRCWTRKESFIKAVGQGLSYPLDSFSVTMDNDTQAEFLKIDDIPDFEKSWYLHSFIPAEDYIAAVSTKGNPKTIRFFEWDHHNF